MGVRVNIFTKIGRSRVGMSLKALAGKVRFPGQARLFFDLVRPGLDEIANQIGDGTSSDVLMTPVRWLQRAIVEAPLMTLDGDGKPIEHSDLTALLNKPNPFYSLEVLLAGTALSLSIDGNAYWIVAHSSTGRPVELWYASHTNVEPVWPDRSDNSNFVTHYKYEVGAGSQNIKPAGVEIEGVDDLEEGLSIIHFRDGVDPSNLRKGLSPVKGLLREIWTDNEAAMFTAALLKNNGVPGTVISPKGDYSLTPDQAKAAKAHAEEHFTGSNRGKPLVNLGPCDVQQFGFSPKELDLSPLRDISEERVTAALGVPAAVVGFGAGLQSTRVGATMKELRQLAWLNGVIPMQRTIAGELGRSLGEAFNAESVAFDNSNVEALRENQDLKAARLGRLVRDSVLTRSEARVELGYEQEARDEVYLLSIGTMEVPQKAAMPMPGNGNGNGDPKSLRDLLWEWPRAATKDHDHGAAEQRIIAAAPSAKPPAVAVRMASRLDAIRRRAPSILQGPLEEVFSDFGQQAEAAARRVLGDVEQVADSGPVEVKQGELAPGDAEVLAEIMDAIDVEAAAQAMQEAIEAGYLQVAVEVSDAIGATFGVDFVLDDAAQQNVMQQGGLNAGLIDLDAQTRDALFDALAEGRAEGMAGDNLARHIRGHIEAGPWGDVATRARVIARTEGGKAANVSTLEAARAMPETEHMQVFDDRIGFGDPDCVEANQSVVTIDEADAMGLAHPNCTRSFVPINALLIEEMFGTATPSGPVRPINEGANG